MHNFSSQPISVVIARFEDLLARGLRTVIESDTSLEIVAHDIELLATRPTTAECSQALAFGASAYLGRTTQARDVLTAIRGAPGERAGSATSPHAGFSSSRDHPQSRRTAVPEIASTHPAGG